MQAMLGGKESPNAGDIEKILSSGELDIHEYVILDWFSGALVYEGCSVVRHGGPACSS